MTAIQTDPALETDLGPDIYIHPEDYTHVITLDPPLPAWPGCLIVECDAFRLWFWLGATWRRKRKVDFHRLNFRRKVPYSRLKPDAIARCGVWILAYADGGNVVHTLEYHNAVDPDVARELMNDARPFHLVEIVTPIPDPSGKPEAYESVMRRATARVNELNRR